LLQKESKIGAAMIVGSGIAGIQASLDLVNSGTKVYLVEEDISIGGVMAQLDKTFPTNDCSACILSPKLVEVGRHPNVEILTRHEIKTVTGEPGHFQVTLERQPRFVDLDKCTGCGECVNVCPVSLPSDFNENLNQRQAIYRKFPQAIPSAFAIDKAGTAPCKAACPAHISVQGYVALIAQGKYREALELIKRDNPFPVVCGRVCNHPCESACMRQEVDDPVAIMYLKRFVADLDLKKETRFIPEIKESKDKKVAVVGAGPAGLTAAYYLAVAGYKVTVFEALPVAGGMLAVGIPDYRLPQDLLAAEIDIIKALGVEIKLNTAIGKDVSISDLQRDYDALFVGVGAHQGSKLGVDGEELDGNIQGIDFLRRVNLGEKLSLGKRVAVVGGGNVAMDAVRTALRTGSEEAFVLYRRTREEMPAADEEIEEALHEGIKMEFLAAPVRIIGDKGKVVGIECVRMELGEADESGRRRPVPIKGSEFILDVDAVVPAIGQTSDLTAFKEIDGISMSRWQTIDVDELTFAATDCGIFAGGDAVSGPATVIEAINAGKEAAISIDRYLAGQDIKAGRKRDWKSNIAKPTNYEKRKKEARIRPAELDPETRKTNFDEVVLAYSEEQARKEAEKCLSCGICSECYQCVDVCIANAIDHEMCGGEETISVGAIIAAPGGEIFDAKLKGEYGFGIYENVVTSIQFERILSASGPFFGHVQRISDAREPKKIAFIQCVGSRDAACGNSWCSSVCCMYATKEAIIAKEHARDLDISIFYMDIRAYGKDFDRFVNRAQDEYGIKYIKSMPSTIKELQQSKNLLLGYALENGQLIEDEFDMVVLSVGFQPPDKAVALAESLGIELEEHGFCRTTQENPMQTSRDGVYVCGVFGGPKDIPETVMEASGAAACASGLLADQRGTLTADDVLPAETDLRGQGPRIGVFVCHCGINIGGVVDVPAVAEYARSLPGVVYVAENLFTCSQDTAVSMAEVIKEHNLTRMVVASCSPRTHEGLFQENCEKAGLNRYLFEMANIRDQNSWVHMHEPEAATVKAKDLVRMAVAKSHYLSPLKPGQLAIDKSALIIGGGLAGITAALALADQGIQSYIIEKEAVLGGNYRHIYYTLEGLDTHKHLAKLLQQVEASELIKVFCNAKISELDGFIGNYNTTIEVSEKSFSLTHGVVLVATGAYELETDEYHYGSHQDIVTQRELEQLIVESEQKGKPQVTGGKHVVMIQCVGSRNAERPYCSRYCCSEAIKNALKLKELDPKTEVTILYRDIRTYGLKEDYYKKARQANVNFIRYNPELPPEVDKTGSGLKVKIFDPILKHNLVLDVDILALSVGSIANPDNDDISRLLKIPVNQDGFFLEAHVKLRPVDFATDGVYFCGMAHSPKFSDEAVVQAYAAVSRATTVLTKDFIEAEGKTAFVTAERCMACGLCEENCPFGAIEVDMDAGQAVVNAVLCKGCGVCTASCRMNAVDLNGFSNEQVLAQIMAF